MRKPRKPVLSPTKINTYLECAVKYRYIYLDKIGRFYMRARPGFSFGSTLHQTLQTFHQEGGIRSPDQLIERFEEGWISAGYESKAQEAEFKTAGVEIVEAYHAASIERIVRQIETVMIESGIRTDLGPFILAGRVDRVDRHPDGTLEIVDYKSGRWDVTEEEVAGNLAMGIYQQILRRNNPGTRVISTIYCLRSGIQASAEMNEEQAGEFERDILALGEEIISRDFENVMPVRIQACEYCDFLSKCESHWKYQARMEAND
jgi:putative RecB family exonuclease